MRRSLLKLLLINAIARILNGNDVDLQKRLDIVEQFVRQNNILCICMEVDQCLAGSLLVQNVQARNIVADVVLVVLPVEGVVPGLSLSLVRSVLGFEKEA